MVTDELRNRASHRGCLLDTMSAKAGRYKQVLVKSMLANDAVLVEGIELVVSSPRRFYLMIT